MARVRINDLDYLAARLHGRRSRLAEAERLDAVCGLRTLPELGHAVFPQTDFVSTVHFQRSLVEASIRELTGFLQHLDGAGGEVVTWLLARFQFENLKVLVRGLVNHVPLGEMREHLVMLPPEMALDAETLAAAESLQQLAELLPPGVLRKSLKRGLQLAQGRARPFFFEAALDHGCFQKLIARAERVSGEDREIVRPILCQEVDIFHLMLVTRGKFHYGLTPEVLSSLHIRQSRINGERFHHMLSAPDLQTVARLALGAVLDALPVERGSADGVATVDPAALEALAWNRFLRLANQAFRRGPIGLGALVGYAVIRRVEVANLVSLSEGIRTGVAADAIRTRLIPRANLEAAHV